MAVTESSETKSNTYVDDGYDEPIDDDEIVEDLDFDLGIPELRHDYVSPEERKRKACWPDGPVREWQKYLFLFILMVLLGLGLGMPHAPSWRLDGWKWLGLGSYSAEVSESPSKGSGDASVRRTSKHEVQSESRAPEIDQHLEQRRQREAREAAEKRRLEVEAEQCRQAEDSAAASAVAAQKQAEAEAEQQAAVGQRAAGSSPVQPAVSTPSVVQQAPAPVEPVDHRTVRSCESPDLGTLPCQGAIDAGGLVRVLSLGTGGDGRQTWVMGHNVTESWILDVRLGDEVMVDGQLYRADAMWDVAYDTQVDGSEPWYQYPVILQTCLSDQAHMRLVGLVAE